MISQWKIEQWKYSATQNNQHFFAGDLLVPEPPSQVQEGLGRVEEGCWEVPSSWGTHGRPQEGSPTPSTSWSTKPWTTSPPWPPPPPSSPPPPPPPALHGPPLNPCFYGWSPPPSATAAALSTNEKPRTGGQSTNQSWGFWLGMWRLHLSWKRAAHQWMRKKSSKASVARSSCQMSPL